MDRAARGSRVGITTTRTAARATAHGAIEHGPASTSVPGAAAGGRGGAGVSAISAGVS